MINGMNRLINGWGAGQGPAATAGKEPVGPGPVPQPLINWLVTWMVRVMQSILIDAIN